MATRSLNVRPAIAASASRVSVWPAVPLSERIAISAAPGTVLFQLATLVQLPPFAPCQLNVWPWEMPANNTVAVRIRQLLKGRIGVVFISDLSFWLVVELES